MLTMVAAQVIGNHAAVTVGGMQGHMELNVFKPLIGANVLSSITLISTGIESFEERLLAGLEPNRASIAELVDRSLMIVTALAPEIGYDKDAQLAQHEHETGQKLKQTGRQQGVVDRARFEAQGGKRGTNG